MTLRDLATIVVIAAMLGLAAWMTIGVNIGGTVVTGDVIAKHESIELPLQDTWRQVFDVSYRYQPREQPASVTGHHSVDAALYERVKVGAPVKVRYRRLSILGREFGIGSGLADASWWSRLPVRSESARQSMEILAMVAAIVLAAIAYRRNTRLLGLIAGAIGVSVMSTVLVLGFVLFPLLLWAWRGNRGRGFGWVLLSSMALTAAGIYERIPQPAPLPSGPVARTVAIVRGLRTVDQIWASWSTGGDSDGGQPIRQPFQMVDVEFTPQGASESVHALDRVDAGSIAGLREGSMVPVMYSLAQPRSAVIAAGTRHFGRRALLHVLELTYGIGGALALIGLVGVSIAQRVVRSCRLDDHRPSPR